MVSRTEQPRGHALTLRLLGLAAAVATVTPATHAGTSTTGSTTSLQFCAGPADLTVAEQSRLLRFAAAVKDELEGSGAAVALIARSGLDLSHFGMRYSHAGISLKASDNTPWSVRQLYYACDERKPLIFDQGIAGFVQGTNEPALGFISLVFVPAAQAASLEQTALDRQQALRLLNAQYSANAYPYSTQFQNCNQWVAEVLAMAWGGIDASAGGEATRRAAQTWLQATGYEPSTFEAGWRPLMWLANAVVPLLHESDHPDTDLAQTRYRVSMPAALEAYVQRQHPQAGRVELCHTERHIVVRRGWQPLSDDCRAEAGDRVIALD